MERGADNVGTREQFARIITHKLRNFHQQRVFRLWRYFLMHSLNFEDDLYLHNKVLCHWSGEKPVGHDQSC